MPDCRFRVLRSVVVLAHHERASSILGDIGAEGVGEELHQFISFSVGLSWSLSDLLALVGLGSWAREVGGLLTLQLSTVAASMPFLLMLLVLLIRPAGLFGDRQ